MEFVRLRLFKKISNEKKTQIFYCNYSFINFLCGIFGFFQLLDYFRLEKRKKLYQTGFLDIL